MFGNRGGMFHDPVGRRLTGRRWATHRWLCCRLDFNGSHRHPVWSRGYTQVFFLDEVTALAAGHRPCFECRREAAIAFRAAAGFAPGGRALPVSALDERLHAERLATRKRLRTERVGRLPEGTIVVIGAEPFALRDGRLLRWCHAGYRDAGPIADGRVGILTPATTVVALAAGYRPVWHPTAA